VDPVVASDQQGVIAGYGHVVQKDSGVRAAADGGPFLVEGEDLSGTSPSAANHERRPRAFDLGVDVHRLDLAGLPHLIRAGGRFLATFPTTDERAALLAVVGCLRVDEATFSAVIRHGT